MQAYELIEMNPEKMDIRRDAHAKSLYTCHVHRTGFVTATILILMHV
ncbi:MAG: hypothetical protein WAW23_07955 [Candidatus Methanoperedens sp.]